MKFNFLSTKVDIEFPVDETYLSAKLPELHISDVDDVTKGLFVEKVVDYPQLKVLENQFVDIETLNYLAKQMDSMDKEELEKTFVSVLTCNEEIKKMSENMKSQWVIGYYEKPEALKQRFSSDFGETHTPIIPSTTIAAG